MRRRASLDAEDANTIPPPIPELNRREISNAVRRDVLVRITHLVNELLLYRRNDDPAAGSFMFGDDKTSVRRRLHNREANIGKIWNPAPLVLAVSARRLRTALDDVTGNRSCCKTIPVVAGPPEFVNQRRQC